MRTTIDIDAPLLAEVKALGKRQGKSLGRVVSDLLAAALAARRPGRKSASEKLAWVARPMQARVDLADREALLDAMEQGAP
ncbi:MAG: hypothetical protein ACOYK7_09850 [Pirellulales bacterium]